jgi:5-methylcytosine-specific restriction endonuclease McrA
MSRTVPEWIGKTDDAKIPARVRDRIYWKNEGYCMKCSRLLIRGQWDCDHIVPLILGGRHRESNLQPLCDVPCHSDKTKLDVKLKAKVARVRMKAIGIRTTRKKIQSPGFRRAEPQRSASRQLEKDTGR